MFYTKISYSVLKNTGKKEVDFRRTGTLNVSLDLWWCLLIQVTVVLFEQIRFIF